MKERMETKNTIVCLIVVIIFFSWMTMIVNPILAQEPTSKTTIEDQVTQPETFVHTNLKGETITCTITKGVLGSVTICTKN